MNIYFVCKYSTVSLLGYIFCIKRAGSSLHGCTVRLNACIVHLHIVPTRIMQLSLFKSRSFGELHFLLQGYFPILIRRCVRRGSIWILVFFLFNLMQFYFRPNLQGGFTQIRMSETKQVSFLYNGLWIQNLGVPT